MLTPDDQKYLNRALALAEQAVGLASPNPTVGCVIVRDGVTLGEGAHVYDRYDHAEIVALKQAAAAGHNVRGATAYVTLEPCSHHGRTGPCAEALALAHVARCVVATVDPNPRVRGEGLAKLRAAGVEVDVAETDSSPAKRARTLNDAFAKFIQTGSPFVTLKAALSVDGMLAPPPSSRGERAPHWVTGEAARADVQLLRHAADALVTGVGAILSDDPLLTDRSGLERRRPLLRVILDSQLRTPAASKIVASAANDLLIVCSQDASREREAELIARGVEIIRLPSRAGRVDPAAVLELLAKRRMLSVMIEAGAAVNGSFLRAGLVDKLVLYYGEQEFGANAVPFAEGIGSPYALQQQLSRISRAAFAHGAAEDIRITGYLRDPWIGVA